jgi:hypothetical protein
MILIAGLKEGYNYPKRQVGDKPVFDFSGCENIIFMDTRYFLQNVHEIERLVAENTP